MFRRVEDVVDTGWSRSKFAEEYFNSLVRRGRRRQFGLLERPSLPPSIDYNVVDYKILLCGRSGVGKTCSVAKLAGTTIPRTFGETAGIETTAVYWPAFIRDTGKVLFFRLNFWDVGDNAIKKFEHILPACQTAADCYIFTFSFTDRASFDEIPHLMSRMTGNDAAGDNEAVHIILGTKADQYIHSDISDGEVDDLSQRWSIPVMRIKNTSDPRRSAMEQMLEISPILDTICAFLWDRDHAKLKGRREQKATMRI